MYLTLYGLQAMLPVNHIRVLTPRLILISVLISSPIPLIVLSIGCSSSFQSKREFAAHVRACWTRETPDFPQWDSQLLAIPLPQTLSSAQVQQLRHHISVLKLINAEFQALVDAPCKTKAPNQ